jgi:exosortase F-associated protein
MKDKQRLRFFIGSICLLLLVMVFLFQKINVATYLGMHDVNAVFIVNRCIRFLLNDLFAMGLIYVLFQEKKYILFSIAVQVAEVALILLPYFVIKIYFMTYNGPLISFLHRLVMNPILLLLLIPAFYYQRNFRTVK